MSKIISIVKDHGQEIRRITESEGDMSIVFYPQDLNVYNPNSGKDTSEYPTYEIILGKVEYFHQLDTVYLIWFVKQ